MWSSTVEGSTTTVLSYGPMSPTAYADLVAGSTMRSKLNLTAAASNGRAVVEHHAGMKLERVHKAVRRDRPAVGQVGMELLVVGAEQHQRIDGVHQGQEARRARRDMGIERVRLEVRRELDLAALRATGGRLSRARAADAAALGRRTLRRGAADAAAVGAAEAPPLDGAAVGAVVAAGVDEHAARNAAPADSPMNWSIVRRVSGRPR